MKKAATLQTCDVMRSYILWFWDSLQVGNYFCKGFTESPIQKKNHIDWSKIRRFSRRPRWDGKWKWEKNHCVTTLTHAQGARNSHGAVESPRSGENRPSSSHAQGEGIEPSLLPHHVPYTSAALTSFAILNLPISMPLLFAHIVPSLLQGPSPYRATCMKCIHSLRPNSNITSSVPVLWLQTTLVWPLWWHWSWFLFLITGCSLVCYSHEIKSLSLACPFQSLSLWPAQCRAQILWEIKWALLESTSS